MKKSNIFANFLILAPALAMALPAHAATVEKNAGETAPIASDFVKNASAPLKKSVYAAQTADGSFTESLRIPCEQNQKSSSAKFIIDVRKLNPGADSGNANTLAFWDDGKAFFNTPLWAAADKIGSNKTLSFDLSELPPSGGAPAGGVRGSNFNGLGMLTDGRLSFSVSADTSVLSARVEYNCAAAVQRTAASGAGANAAVGGAFGLGVGPTVAIGALSAIALGAALSSGNDGNGGAAGTTGTTGTSR